MSVVACYCLFYMAALLSLLHGRSAIDSDFNYPPLSLFSFFLRRQLVPLDLDSLARVTVPAVTRVFLARMDATLCDFIALLTWWPLAN